MRCHFSTASDILKYLFIYIYQYIFLRVLFFFFTFFQINTTNYSFISECLNAMTLEIFASSCWRPYSHGVKYLLPWNHETTLQDSNPSSVISLKITVLIHRICPLSIFYFNLVERNFLFFLDTFLITSKALSAVPGTVIRDDSLGKLNFPGETYPTWI